ncbi:MAG: hypothetical protein GX947_10035 [Tissierellia bacterium]|nr:hypothetical protein [Tissierellia bacterium]
MKKILCKRIGVFYGYVTPHGTLLANGKYLKSDKDHQSKFKYEIKRNYETQTKPTV